MDYLFGSGLGDTAHRNRLRDFSEIDRLIVFDADNTLWDTNEVFLNAQLEFIKYLSEHETKVGESEGIKKLREIDQILIKIFERSEYDFVFLWRALSNYYKTGEFPSSSDLLQIPHKAENIVLQRFQHRLTELPRLLPGVRETIRSLKASMRHGDHSVIGIFSEGKLSRLKRVFEYHNDIVGLMDFVVVGDKTPESYSTLTDNTGSHTSFRVMIGDSIKKDIEAPHLAGYKTIFIPSRYAEQNINLVTRADFTLDSMHDLLPVLDSFEVIDHYIPG